MTRKIKRLREVVAYSVPENRWVKVYFDAVAFPNGSTGRYNRVVENNGIPGVAILPIRGSEVGLVKQHRYPIDKFVWEIPRGFGESKDPRADAERELREETGIDIADFLELGNIHPNSGLLATQVKIFAAFCDPDTEGGIGDGVEIEAFRWLPASTALAEIEEGKITDAFTLSAILLAKTRGLI